MGARAWRVGRAGTRMFASVRAEREDADYFKAAYARKLDDEKRALETAAALADALEALLHADPGAADCNHPACRGAREALRLAGRLP